MTGKHCARDKHITYDLAFFSQGVKRFTTRYRLIGISYFVQGSPSGGRRMRPGGAASRKALKIEPEKMRKQAIKRPHTEA